VDAWDEHFANHFLGLSSEELEVVKEWLLYLCEYPTYRMLGPAASGPGDHFGRVFDTVGLLQKEIKRKQLRREFEK
jgi:hypothetical protein